METNMRIRPVTEADAPALLEIYGPYVRDSAITFEYDVPTAQEFAARIRHTLQRYPYLAAEADGRVLGYAYAGAFNPRRAYDWAVETTVYVRQDCRRGGVGRALYAALEEALRAQGILNLNACIAEPAREDPYLTRDSAAFHSRLGYTLVGRFHRCGYKFGRWYDMIWMEKEIGPHLAQQPPVRSFGEVAQTLASLAADGGRRK